MSKFRGGIGLMLLIALSLSACSAGGATTAEPDRVGTRVAEELAIAQTLTAVARQAAPAATEVAQIVPTATIIPLTSTTKTTDVPPTKVPATHKPTVAAPKPPMPTNTAQPQQADPFVPATPTMSAQPQQADPFVPGGGDPRGLVGRMLLPGYKGPALVDEPIFDQQIVFRLFVYDPNFGNNDGAGINSVDMQISDPNGRVVQSRTEQNAAYCVFSGGEPDCLIWAFAEHDNQWPDGTPVCAGSGYQAVMTVDAKDDNNDNALWQFNFAIDGDYPPC